MSEFVKKVIALIPARAGSKRVENKNILRVNGHPLIAYTISAAIESGVFSYVYVSTDSETYAEIASHYGARVDFLRPSEFASDASPDIDWVEFSLRELKKRGQNFDSFSILRPTSPFRTAETIRRAYLEFSSDASVDSLRAVELCVQHPAKMWKIFKNRLVPIMQRPDHGVDWFSSPTQSLPEIWVQNASLEFAHAVCVEKYRSISGNAILPFKTNFPEGFDINRPEDVFRLNEILKSSPDLLPKVSKAPFD